MLEQHAGGVAQVEPALLARLRRLGDALVLVVGKTAFMHVGRRHLAAADGGQHVLDVLAGQPRQHRLQAVLGEGLAGALEGALEDAVRRARNIACGWRSWSPAGWRRAPCR